MIKIVLALLLFPAILVAHGGHRAVVTITPTDTAITVEVSVATPDLDQVLEDAELCAPDQDRMVCEAGYLSSTLTVTINGEQTPLYLDVASRTAERTIVTFTVPVKPTDVKVVGMRSTCLLDHDPKYRTMVNLRLVDDVSYELTNEQSSFSHTVR